MVVHVASYDVAIGEGRFIVGLVTQEEEAIGHGTVDLEFAYLGSKERPKREKFGPSVTATFLAIPGEAPSQPPARGPMVGPASQQARGVYSALVGFDRAGFWKVRASADVKEVGKLSGSAAFEVLAEHQVPAPGNPALRTENLTVASKDAPRAAIDSRAGSGELPDPELHTTTIASAIERDRPTLVVFSTPTYCVSRFCGPVTDMVLGLARDYKNRAEFVHVEIWRDFEKGKINKAAAEWLQRGDDLQEPWVFLIGGDGKIIARWDNVATREEIEPLLKMLPSGADA